MASKPQFVGERVRLGELISKAAVVRSGNGSYPVYSMTMHDGIVKQAGRFKKTIASKDTSAYKVVKRNQLVVGFPIDEGVLYVQNFDEPGIMSPAYSVWDINLDRVLPDYLDLVLHSPQCMAYYKEKMRGTTARRRTLTSDGLRSLEIPLPSIQQQRCVVGIMATVKLQINHARSVINQIDSLVKSRFVEMFGDPIENPRKLDLMRIDQIASVQTGATPLRSEQRYFNGSIPWVKTGEIADDFVHGIEERITEAAIAETNCKVFPSGTILIAMYGQGDTRGKAAILPVDASTNQACAAILLKDGFDKNFILAQLRLRYEDLRSLSLGGNQKNLSLKIIKSYELMIPPFKQQQDFMAFVAQVDKPRFVAHGGSYLVQENRHLSRGSSVSPSFSKACFMS